MPLRILVVDDHPAIALALTVFLRRDERFEVTDSASTAAEGLELLDGHDVVMLDLHLPDLTGPALVQAFRERDPRAKIVLHSAADDTPDAAAVRDLVDAVVLKGSFSTLLAVLTRMV
jgi:DNA-binding NarL/FixJ family response regulator